MHSTEGKFLEKKNFHKRQKNLLQNPKKAKKTKGFLLFQFSSVENQKPNQKSFLFLLDFSFKTAFKSNKRLQSQFPRQNYKSKRWTPSEGRINTASTSFSTPFFIIFVLFNFLFDLIFYYCVDYLLIIFIILYFDGWNDVNNGGDTQRPMVCHGLIM